MFKGNEDREAREDRWIGRNVLWIVAVAYGSAIAVSVWLA